MRMLFSCLTGSGSLHPHLFLALAAQKAGHEVAFATGGESRSALERFGLSLYPVGSRLSGLVRSMAHLCQPNHVIPYMVSRNVPWKKPIT